MTSLQNDNTNLIIENDLNAIQENVDSRTTHVIIVSTKIANSFKKNTRRLINYIDSNSKIRLQNLTYITIARRMHHVFRKTYIVQSFQQFTHSM